MVGIFYWFLLISMAEIQTVTDVESPGKALAIYDYIIKATQMA